MRKSFTAHAVLQTFTPPPCVTVRAQTGPPGAVADPYEAPTAMNFTAQQVVRVRVLATLDEFFAMKPTEEVPQLGGDGFPAVVAFLEHSYNFVPPPSCVTRRG